MPTKVRLDSNDRIVAGFWTDANVTLLPDFVPYSGAGTNKKGAVPVPPASTDKSLLLTSGWGFTATANTLVGWNGSKAPILYGFGVANGVATLDSNGLVPSGQLPAKTIDVRVVVANSAARLALTNVQVQNGDFVQETDTGFVYELVDDTAISTAGSWVKVKGIISTDIGDSTSVGRSLLTAATAAAARTAIVALSGINDLGNTEGPALLLTSAYNSSSALPIFKINVTDSGFSGPVFSLFYNGAERFGIDNSGAVSGLWYVFHTDTSTGMRPNGSHVLDLFTNNTTRLRVSDTAVTFGTDIGLTFAGTGAITTRTNLGLVPSSNGHVIWVSQSTTATDTRTGLSAYDTAVPFATLAAAKAVAAAGDLVMVWPGSYTITARLAKHQTSWYFAPGTTVTYDGGTDNTGIWDDGGSQVITVVRGSGIFVRSDDGEVLTAQCVVRSSHANSSIDVEGLDFIATAGSTSVVKCIDGEAGSLRVRARDVTASGDTSYGVWWGNGKMDVEGRYCTGTNGVGIQCNATPTGHGDIRFVEISAIVYAVWEQGSNTTAACWVSAARLASTSNPTVWLTGANRVYVTAQKNFGTLGYESTWSGQFYFKAFKVSTVVGSNDDLYFATAGCTGVADIQVDHWDPTGCVGGCFTVNGGTHHIKGGRLKAVSGSNGIALSAGSLSLYGMRVDTTANSSSNPITITGGSLFLETGTKLLAQGSRDSISAVAPHTVVAFGMQNNDANANITFLGNMITVPSLV